MPSLLKPNNKEMMEEIPNAGTASRTNLVVPKLIHVGIRKGIVTTTMIASAIWSGRKNCGRNFLRHSSCCTDCLNGGTCTPGSACSFGRRMGWGKRCDCIPFLLDGTTFKGHYCETVIPGPPDWISPKTTVTATGYKNHTETKCVFKGKINGLWKYGTIQQSYPTLLIAQDQCYKRPHCGHVAGRCSGDGSYELCLKYFPDTTISTLEQSKSPSDCVFENPDSDGKDFKKPVEISKCELGCNGNCGFNWWNKNKNTDAYHNYATEYPCGGTTNQRYACKNQCSEDLVNCGGGRKLWIGTCEKCGDQGDCGGDCYWENEAKRLVNGYYKQGNCIRKHTPGYFFYGGLSCKWQGSAPHCPGDLKCPNCGACASHLVEKGRASSSNAAQRYGTQAGRKFGSACWFDTEKLLCCK